MGNESEDYEMSYESRQLPGILAEECPGIPEFENIPASFHFSNDEDSQQDYIIKNNAHQSFS